MMVPTENAVSEEPVYCADIVSLPVVLRVHAASPHHQGRDHGKGRGVAASGVSRMSALVHS